MKQLEKFIGQPKKKARVNKKSLAFYMAAFMTASMQFVYGANDQKKFIDGVEGAAQGIQAVGQGVAKWLLVIGMVVIGLIFTVGTQRQKESAKEGIGEKIIGIAVVVFAFAIAGFVFGWFGIKK